MKFWQKRIYADAAAAMPLSPRVQREMTRLLALYGNPSALHAEAVAAKKELDSARERVAASIGAHADEIFFVSGGTEANNLAIFGTLKKLLRVGERVHAITSAIEHASVLEPLSALMDDGLELTILPIDEGGLVSYKALREALREDTVFVSIQMINSEVGTIQNIHELAKEVRHARKEREDNLPIYFHTDASQAPLWLPLRVDALGVDLMTLDAQKMYGPKGAGVLFARRGVQMEPLIYGGGQEAGLRSGTENVMMAGACAAALEDAQRGVELRAEEIARIRDFLFEEIKKVLPDVRLNGIGGKLRVANNLNISIPRLNGDMATVALSAEGIAVSTRSACDADDESPSHVLAALGLSPQQAKNSIRITLLPSATRGEARRIAKTLAEVVARYRQTK